MKFMYVHTGCLITQEQKSYEPYVLVVDGALGKNYGFGGYRMEYFGGEELFRKIWD